MTPEEVISRDLISEVDFSFSRSSGSGGQNVNKVNTKAELRFNISQSEKLTQEEKSMLIDAYNNNVSKEGVLIIISQESRSQLENRQICVQKFIKLISKATTNKIKRVKTKRSIKSIEERLAEKSKRSILKANRKDMNTGTIED
jgi:ribosome-associated protein